MAAMWFLPRWCVYYIKNNCACLLLWRTPPPKWGRCALSDSFSFLSLSSCPFCTALSVGVGPLQVLGDAPHLMYRLRTKGVRS